MRPHLNIKSNTSSVENNVYSPTSNICPLVTPKERLICSMENDLKDVSFFSSISDLNDSDMLNGLTNSKLLTEIDDSITITFNKTRSLNCLK